MKTLTLECRGADQMPWQSLSEGDLWGKLNQACDRMTPEQRRVWEAIRVPPQKWMLTPYGIQGGGFWVVGLIGRTVVWYNDIEEGFNRSRYERYGTISDYYCNQDDLEIAIQGIVHFLREGVESGPFAGPPRPGVFPGRS
jgi:hypothetical protein